jgi:hypothetical protein
MPMADIKGPRFGWSVGWQNTASKRTSFNPSASRLIAGRVTPKT